MLCLLNNVATLEFSTKSDNFNCPKNIKTLIFFTCLGACMTGWIWDKWCMQALSSNKALKNETACDQKENFQKKIVTKSSEEKNRY